MTKLRHTAEITVGAARVSFDYIGEGRSGDYNPDDPADEPLLRLDCQVRADSGYGGEPTGDPEWLYPDGGSICTSVPEGTDDATRTVLLTYAAVLLDDAICGDQVSVKRVMERLSWLPDMQAVARLM